MLLSGPRSWRTLFRKSLNAKRHVGRSRRRRLARERRCDLPVPAETLEDRTLLSAGDLLQTLENPAPSDFDQFGSSAAIDGDKVVVGARGEDVGFRDSGAVHLFDAVTGNVLRTFNNPSPAVNDQFGFSVAIDGNNVLVGARLDDTGERDAGAAYLFDAASGNLLQTFINPTPASGEQFGWSVGIDGNNVLIGAPFDQTGANSAGSAYLFDAITGNLLRTFNNPAPAMADDFGWSVAIDGNSILIGAPFDDAGVMDVGTTYLFDASSGNLVRTFSNPAPDEGDLFGWSVAIDGSNIVIGAIRDNTTGISAGSAYLFDAASGILLDRFDNPTPAFGDNFGFSVALDGNSVLIGEPLGDDNLSNSGSAHLFDLVTGNLITTIANPSARSDGFGGDPIGIGLSKGRAVVGALSYSSAAHTWLGRAYIFDVDVPRIFAPTDVYASGAHGPSSLATADFNNDRALDIVSANIGRRAGILINNGDGASFNTLVTPTNEPFGQDAYLDVATGDFNRDGDQDFVASTRDGFRVWLGDGNAGFTMGQFVFARASSIATGDLDGDGILDVVTALDGVGPGIHFFRGLGNGDFSFVATLRGAATCRFMTSRSRI